MTAQSVENSVCMQHCMRDWTPRRLNLFVVFSTFKYGSFLKFSIGYCMVVISQLLT